jgi:capsular polysaccharide transport system permease protein
MSMLKPSALTRLFKNGRPREVARLPERALSLISSAPNGRRSPQVPRWVRKYSAIGLIIVLPTLITSAYYFLIAADQYASEAQFIIRGAGSTSAGSFFGQLLSSSSIIGQTSQEDLLTIGNYMQSHDALKALQEKIDLATLFRRPEADWFARLKSNATAEDFLDYYKGRVTVDFDALTGIATMRVRAFRPEDAEQIAQTLLALGEAKVNSFSDRQREDTLKVARTEVDRAEQRVFAARDQMTQFRDREKTIDPGKSSAIVMELIGKLEGQLAQTRAEITEASAYLKPDNAKLISLRNKADAVQSQIVAEKKRLTGDNTALAPVVSAYERLMLEREFSDKGYASAMLSQETARTEAMKQHYYLVRVVEPNLPEKALYPKRVLTVSTLFVALCFTYGIGWLIISGIREHTA